MSLILAADTSATAVSCAVMREERLLASFFSHTGLTHSQTLMPMIDSALSVAGVTADELDALAVNVGPGSFTGVRIGVSAVKGIAFASDKPCLPVSTLEAMAEGVRGIPFDGLVCGVMDARCQQVYTAVFRLDPDGGCERLTPDEAMPIAQLGKFLKNQNKSVIMVGDGSEMCYNALKEDLPGLYLAPASVRYQSAVGTARVAARMLAQGKTVSPGELLPLYLRLPQAERELRARQNARK